MTSRRVVEQTYTTIYKSIFLFGIARQKEKTKKNETWQFSTAYRALNEVVVKDRFPILIVDKM